MKLVECVPNFSEGRDRGVIDSITGVIEQVEGVTLLDVDPGAATNRTVVTFVGSPEGVAEAAFLAIAQAARVIDMQKHSGAHARMGATDVCPFVPVSGVTMDDCVEIARHVGERVGKELEIPIYLYENACTRKERRSLATIRRGEYEGLREKLADPEWRPDFGPATFSARSGATVIGAREFLIAYNVNLNTRDRRLAQDIALDIREAGRAKRDEQGKIVRGPDGKSVKVPGKFKEVRGVGWYIEEYGCAQVSMNLTNYKVSPVHAVFDEICEQATRRGLRVTGSELVGLIPLEAVLSAGRHYLERQGRTTGVPESEIIHTAIKSLGLEDLTPFDPGKKIIEYRVAGAGADALVGRTVSRFLEELSTDSPAPGGGSAAALCGSLSAALSSMVAALTHAKKGMEERREEMGDSGVRAQELVAFFRRAIDEDTDAFNAIVAARRLPKKTDEDREARDRAMLEATRNAIRVPLEVLRRSGEALELAEIVSTRGLPASLSDAGVAGLAAAAAAEGAYYNVLINLDGFPQEDYARRTRAEAGELLEDAQRRAEIIRGRLRETL
jgi:glutamate formiminotransferase/formiminotetrahydrofolate cyclodeaminase